MKQHKLSLFKTIEQLYFLKECRQNNTGLDLVCFLFFLGQTNLKFLFLFFTNKIKMFRWCLFDLSWDEHIESVPHT